VALAEKMKAGRDRIVSELKKLIIGQDDVIGQVLLTLFGSTADLDRIGASPIVISLNVAQLEPGTHELPVVPSLPSVVTVAAISPETIVVTVEPRATPSPGLSGGPSPGASAPASPAPSPEPSPTPAA
jgi:hypothetical protein